MDSSDRQDENGEAAWQASDEGETEVRRSCGCLWLEGVVQRMRRRKLFSRQSGDFFPDYFSFTRSSTTSNEASLSSGAEPPVINTPQHRATLDYLEQLARADLQRSHCSQEEEDESKPVAAPSAATSAIGIQIEGEILNPQEFARRHSVIYSPIDEKSELDKPEADADAAASNSAKD
eukprot:Polyplicarium_translucidae@DN2271_c0_g1_i2.p1